MRVISLYSKYQFLKFIFLPVMNSPVFPSLDDIYCMFYKTYSPSAFRDGVLKAEKRGRPIWLSVGMEEDKKIDSKTEREGESFSFLKFAAKVGNEGSDLALKTEI